MYTCIHHIGELYCAVCNVRNMLCSDVAGIVIAFALADAVICYLFPLHRHYVCVHISVLVIHIDVFINENCKLNLLYTKVNE